MKTPVRRLRFIPHASYLILSLLLSACSRTAPPAGLTIINGPEPESLDPALITAQADGRVVQALFEGLTRYDARTAMPVPGLAERWDISPDGKIYTFHLRSNAVWSTGEPITAHDVVYSWRRVLDPLTAAEYAGQLFFLKNGEEFASAKTNATTGRRFTAEEVGVRALDDRTLRVELNNPTAFFLDLCAFQTLAVVPRGWIERHGDRWLMTPPVPVSGAYLLDAWRINDKIRLRKNPRYWDAANTRTEIIDLLPCSSANTALNLYETGAADIVWDKSLVPSEMLDVLMRRPDFHSFDYLGTYFFRFNVTRKPFDDPRVRKAFALAVDKRRIVTKISRGGEKPASAFTPPGVAGYRPPEGLGYNPDEARRLLAEAGFPGGKNFPRFSYLLDAKLHEQVGVELQAMWKQELGVSVELRQIETKAYYRAQSELDYDLCRSSWIGDYNDANTFLDMFMSNNGNNRTGWKNARYDQLVRAANAQVDAAQREKLLQQAETILIREEVPIVPLYIYVGLEYFDPRKISGVHPNIRGEHPLRTISKAGNF
ncbi:MAG: peptide ABC transporter substrate-binding protein [Verrucomicrobia bacterium]|nr:peptide ABC transporter substrate-binding protein [Verrucomicrobiota bacterium]